MKKKGIILIMVIGVIYWGHYYIFRKPSRPARTGFSTGAPVEDFVHKTNLNILETSIEIFRQSEGKYPGELNELVEKGYLEKLPDSGGRNWKYNPGNGIVS